MLTVKPESTRTSTARAKGMTYPRIIHVVPAPMSDDHQQEGQHHA